MDINRATTKTNWLSHQQKRVDKAERKARTRTLIQTGALLKLVGFFDVCQILEGEDLQLNFEHQAKAARLLGILMEAFEALPVEPTAEQLEHWEKMGIRFMKMHTAKHYNNKFIT